MILKVGHRGCAYEPENTLPSFKKAVSLGADMLECDAQLTKDGKLVVIHDRTVNRTTDGRGKISKLTLAELKKLDAGKGEQIPTLEEVIHIARNNAQLNIEIKEAEAAEKVAETLMRERFVKNSLVSASQAKILLKIKQINPKIKTALVCSSLRNRFFQFCFDLLGLIFSPILKKKIIRKMGLAQTDTVNLRKYLATKNMIRYLHKNKIKINVWTVNKKKEIEKFKGWEVEGIFSDYPERI